ncbi:MAG: hypothetical protein ACXADW_21015 [Candidatus Hodarchaeales archaeon]|jgi:hypothetical protein
MEHTNLIAKGESMEARKQYWSDVTKAAQEFNNRKNRTSHPNGKTDNGGRWYPSESEKCDCCDRIRDPSRSHPWSLMAHCRTGKHVARLYNVEYRDLIKTAKETRN